MPIIAFGARALAVDFLAGALGGGGSGPSIQGGVVRVQGGDRVRRFVSSELSAQNTNKAARLFVQYFPIARLRNAVPYRTGRLSRSLRLVQRGSSIELRGIFYTSFAPNRAVVVDAFHRLAAETQRRVIARLRADRLGI